MRAVHGNTRNGTWKKQNKLPHDSTLQVGTVNTNGLSVANKRLAIQDLTLDVIALTETHLQSHLHAAYVEQWKNFNCHFSPDPDSKHYNGVALLFIKSCFWKTSTIQWPEDSACHKFVAIGRLVAVQAWLGHGGSSIIRYNLYAPSGSRWETARRKQLNELFDAITEDSIARGQIPAIVLGDFNMPISECTKLSTSLSNRTWCDTRNVADAVMYSATTCHVGPSKGSTIDHIFVSPSLFDLIFNFQVKKLAVFKDQSQV
jgi:exonuclease III